MKPQARREPLLIKTVAGKNSVTQIWDGTSPLALGRPFRVIVERTEDGARIRDLKGTVHKVTEAQIQEGIHLKLVGGGPNSPTSMSMKQSHAITPPYIAGKTAATSASELFAYGGLRRTIVSCNAVHSAFVAYERGKPAFAAYKEGTGLRIKTFTSGVRLKFKGAAPKVGAAGDVWTLTAQELETATVFKGWYWWRFNEVLVPAKLGKGIVKPDEENKFFKRTLLALTLFLFLCTSLYLFLRPPVAEIKEEILNTPTVTLAKKEKIFAKTRIQPAKEVSVAPAPHPAPKALPKSTEEAAPSKPSSSSADRIADARSKKALSQAKNVTQTLSAIKALQSKTAFNSNSESGKSVFGNIPSNVGTVGKTTVAPMSSGSNIQVKNTGGGNGKGKADGYGGLGTGIQSSGSGTNSFVTLGTSGSRVDEGLTKDEVGAVIHSHMSEIRYCHQAAMLQNPKVGGKLDIQFTISGQGRVTVANVEASTLNTPSFDGCVLDRLKTWAFPKPRGGVTVNVSYPFMFKTMEEER